MAKIYDDDEFENLMAQSGLEQNDQPTNQSTNQSINQETNQPTSQPTLKPHKKPGAPAKYNWDAWIDGKLHVAERGEDFDIPAIEFMNRLHNYARRKELFVSSEVLGDGNVEFCFYRSKALREAAKYGA